MESHGDDYIIIILLSSELTMVIRPKVNMKNRMDRVVYTYFKMFDKIIL
jgi:hypothetical protein